jgi:hypothetical protein
VSGLVAVAVVVVGVFLFVVMVREDEALREMEREEYELEERWYDQYFDEWMASDEIEMLSPEAWQRELDAPKLPPAEIKPRTPYR